MSGVKIRVVDHGAKRAKALMNQPRKKLLLGVLPEDADRHHSKGVTIGEVAMWMEYGTDDGHIPARSWLFDWLDENVNDIVRQLATDTLRVLFGQPPENEKQALSKRGTKYRREIVDRIEQIPGNWRALEKSTIRRKGGLDTPLIDTETFIDSIRWKVE